MMGERARNEAMLHKEDLRVLLVRTSALGDLVHALPSLRALRSARPNATIGWVVEEAFAPLLRAHPDLDQLFEVHLRGWRRHPLDRATRVGLAQLVSTLRGFHADVVLDLMGNHKAGVLGLLAGCSRRVGLARVHRREPASAIFINVPVAPRGRHAVERALSVLGPLGIEPGAPDFGGERLFRGQPPPELPLAGPFVVVHPGAGWSNKQYPAEWWGAVARAVAEDPGIPTLVVTGPSEAELGERTAAASDGSATHLAVPTLAPLAAVLRSASLVLGGDSGPVHLAHALGTPVLCLMGPTDPDTNGPYGAPEAALFRRLACSFCHQRLAGTRACLLSLSPSEVTAKARSLLAVR